MSTENLKVHVMSVDVGEGNPSAALAASVELGRNYPVSLTTINQSAAPADAWHRRMSTSVSRSASYSKNGNGLREKGAYFLGPAMFAEFRLKNPGLFLPRLWRRNSKNALIGTQELPFSGTTKDELDRVFQGGVRLLIPDVNPKETSEAVMKKGLATPVVWNKDAFARLRAIGLEPELVRPFLPIGMYDYDGKGSPEGILVKSSGSGMPEEHISTLKEVLAKLGLPFRFYLPDRKITNSGEEPRSKNKHERIADFHRDLITYRPRVIFSGPSEMTMVAAAMAHLGTVQVQSRPRGEHEGGNQNWATKHGLATVVERMDSETIKDAILRAYEKTPVANPGLTEQLGTEPLASVLRR